MISSIDLLNYFVNCLLAYQGSTLSLSYDKNNKFKALVFGFVTAVGGGTLRDLVYHKLPFFIKDQIIVFTALFFSFIGVYYNKLY